jgi:hypothetical protein
MQTRPIHSINQRGELRRRQPHHAVRDRRPPECTLLQPLPIQHQARAIPDQNLHSVCSPRAERKDRSGKRIVSERLAYQGDKPIDEYQCRRVALKRQLYGQPYMRTDPIKTGLHLPDQIERCKMGTEHRLRQRPLMGSHRVSSHPVYESRLRRLS